MIESSAMFKTGFIRLYKTIGKEEPLPQPSKKSSAPADNKKEGEKAAPAKPADEAPTAPAEETQANSVPADAAPSEVPYAYVKTIEEARKALKEHGANAGVLLNVTAMKNYMAANGIVFPNFEF